VEERAAPRTKPAARRAPASGAGPAREPTPIGALVAGERARLTSSIDEFDFVLGGGIVPGSMVLVGGEPGIGKSTLLLQVAAGIVRQGGKALYVSAEESPLQVRLRAERLSADANAVEFLSETSIEVIIATSLERSPTLLVVDSIQTVFTEDLEGAPGNVAQVRESAAKLMRLAKESGTAIVVVGHVTKGGGIAGPKTLEHIVDTVLYFEGDAGLDHRVLRATKNRFGSVDEIGVFRMTPAGLEPVENPSLVSMGDREHVSSGSALTALMEGTRPLLVEVQALASKAGFGTPQRVSSGLDGRRLALLLAVLDKRAGLSFAQLDAFVNVVGGLRLVEPGADLAIAAALASSVYDRSIPRDALLVGEVGLGGEVRSVSQLDRRLAEGARLGVNTAYVPERSMVRAPTGLRVGPVRDLAALFQRLVA
jgi:DNA repair protein RadA/Sms